MSTSTAPTDTRRTGTKMVIMLAVLGLVGVTAVLAAVLRVGAPGRVPIKAEFANAAPLVPGNHVKSSGVTVGEIVGIELQPDSTAVVSMLVDRSVLPIHVDSRAVITSKDILGETFVDVQRGSPGSPRAAEPIVIPQQRTDKVVDVQDVVNAFDDPTNEALASMVRTFGQGLEGQGTQAAEAIRALAPAMQRTSELARVLDSQNAVLNRLIDSTEPVTAELAAGRGRQLDRMVGATERLLSSTAADRQAVAASLQRLPGTLQNARRTLSEVAGVAEQATPGLESIRPITDNLTAIDGELRRFADSLDPALASLPPVLDRAQELIDEAGPLVANDLKPLGPDLRGVTESARPLSERGFSLRIENLMKFIKFWSLSTAGYDGVSHYFRASVPLTPEALCRSGTGTLGTLAPPVLPPDVTCDAVPAIPAGGELPGNPQGAPAALPADLPTDGLAPVGPVAGGGATGLTPRQEDSMLGQMLGGR